DRILADAQLAQVLEVGQAVEEQDALGQLVGMLHLVDRLVVLVLGEFLQPPVLQHPGVQEVLVDRNEFVVERLVQVLDDPGVAFHGGCAPSGSMEGMLARRPFRRRNGNRVHHAAFDNTGRGNSRAAWTSSSMPWAMSTQLPQHAPAPVRMVSSERVRQPASATSRISWSVIPLQMQTYTGRPGMGRRQSTPECE